MSKSKVSPQAPTTNVPTPVPADLADLLHTVEDRCNRAVQVINVTERAIVGDELNMYDQEDVRVMLGAGLERLAEELTALSNRALRARTAGGAA